MAIEPCWLTEALSSGDGDSEALTLALDRAATHHGHDEVNETLEWLRHAAQIAKNEGRVDRAGALADAADEFAALTARRSAAAHQCAQDAPTRLDQPARRQVDLLGTVRSCNPSMEPLRAMRVALLAGEARPSLLLLAENEPPPSGTQLALLIPLAQ